MCAACIGLHVVLTCEDIMKDRYFTVHTMLYLRITFILILELINYMQIFVERKKKCNMKVSPKMHCL